MTIIKAVFDRKEQFQLMVGFARKNFSRSNYRSFLLILGVLLTIALETGIAVSVVNPSGYQDSREDSKCFSSVEGKGKDFP